MWGLRTFLDKSKFPFIYIFYKGTIFRAVLPMGKMPLILSAPYYLSSFLKIEGMLDAYREETRKQFQKNIKICKTI